jgi:hypothetical protein
MNVPSWSDRVIKFSQDVQFSLVALRGIALELGFTALACYGAYEIFLKFR